MPEGFELSHLNLVSWLLSAVPDELLRQDPLSVDQSAVHDRARAIQQCYLGRSLRSIGGWNDPPCTSPRICGTHEAVSPPDAKERSGRLGKLLPFAVLLLAGGTMRALVVPDARFAADEASFYEMSQSIARDGARPVLGPPVSGSGARLPGPGFYAVVSLPALISSSAFVASAFIGILSLAAMSLIVHLVLLTRGPLVAAFTAAMISVSPWCVLYSDRVWGSNVFPSVAAVIFYGLWRARAQPRSVWVAPTVALLVILPQMHLSAPVVFASLLGFLFGPRPLINLRLALLGLVAGIVAWIPPLSLEASTGFANVRAILTEGTGGAGSSLRSAASVFEYGFLMATGEISYFLNEGYWKPFDVLEATLSLDGLARSLAWHGSLAFVFILASVGISAFGYWRMVSRSRNPGSDPALGPLVFGILVSAVMVGIARKPPQPHYVNALIGLAVVPFAVGAEVMISSGRGLILRLLGGALVAGVLITQAISTLRYNQEIDAKSGLSTVVEVAKEITRREEPFELVLRAPLSSIALRVAAERHLQRRWLRQEQAPVKYLVGDGSLEAPPDAVRAGRAWVLRIAVSEANLRPVSDRAPPIVPASLTR